MDEITGKSTVKNDKCISKIYIIVGAFSLIHVILFGYTNSYHYYRGTCVEHDVMKLKHFYFSCLIREFVLLLVFFMPNSAGEM